MSHGDMHRVVAEIEDTAASWVFRREAGLTPAEQAAFDRWRAADSRNDAALTRHQRAWSALDRPRKAGQASLLLEKLAERTSRRRRRAVAISAACALLIAGTTFWTARHPSAALPENRTLVVLPETRTLEDGSIVEMKPGAQIAVDFSGAFRRVALRRGEAHFQVARQSRPFVVTAGNVEFRAVGTAFSVQLAGAQVELLVTEGRVAVEKPAGSPPAGVFPEPTVPAAIPSLATVAAGYRVVVELAGERSVPALTPSVVPPDEMTERLVWRAPRLEFSATPLAEAVALMNRHGGAKLVIEDAELGKLPVSGLFRADRTEAFVRLLEANFGVRAEQAGQTTRLHRKR